MEEKIWFQRRGGGSSLVRINGRRRIIKPNEKFQAFLSEIPETVRDVLVPLSSVKVGEVDKIEVVKPVYTLKFKGGGWFDVIAPNGKVMNDKSLRQAEAEAFIEKL